MNLEEWCEFFRLAEESSLGSEGRQAYFSQADLDERKVTFVEALGFKTPARIKRKAKDEPEVFT